MACSISAMSFAEKRPLESSAKVEILKPLRRFISSTVVVSGALLIAMYSDVMEASWKVRLSMLRLQATQRQ
eukprot:scaffold6349_cov167-Amphora_coffeaeformis.AAC.3